MDQPYFLFLAAGGIKIVEEFAVVGVAGERIEGVDLGADGAFLTEDLHFLITVANL